MARGLKGKILTLAYYSFGNYDLRGAWTILMLKPITSAEVEMDSSLSCQCTQATHIRRALTSTVHISKGTQLLTTLKIKQLHNLHWQAVTTNLHRGGAGQGLAAIAEPLGIGGGGLGPMGRLVVRVVLDWRTVQGVLAGEAEAGKPLTQGGLPEPGQRDLPSER